MKVTYSMLEELWLQETVTQPGKSGVASSSRISYLDFFRDPELRKKTILLMGIWFSWSIVYFGLSYNAKNLRGDPCLNVAYMGFSDALGYPAALLINNKQVIVCLTFANQTFFYDLLSSKFYFNDAIILQAG
jgi:hypothetical protein